MLLVSACRGRSPPLAAIADSPTPARSRHTIATMDLGVHLFDHAVSRVFEGVAASDDDEPPSVWAAAASEPVAPVWESEALLALRHGLVAKLSTALAMPHADPDARARSSYTPSPVAGPRGEERVDEQHEFGRLRWTCRADATDGERPPAVGVLRSLGGAYDEVDSREAFVSALRRRRKQTNTRKSIKCCRRTPHPHALDCSTRRFYTSRCEAAALPTSSPPCSRRVRTRRSAAAATARSRSR